MARSYTLKSSPKPDGAAGGLDYASLLNEQQLEAVTSKPGAALVIAGAGSGKTRTLTYRVAYLLEEGYKPYNILLLTFTNKAAGEMLTRVGQLVPQDMHGIWGGTFHAIGNRILRKYGELLGYTSGFSIMDREDQTSLITQVRKESGLGKDGKKQAKRFPRSTVLADIYSITQNLDREIDDILHERYLQLEEYFNAIKTIGRGYTKKKLDSNAVDFDDLLCQPLKLLEAHQEVREHYQEKFHAVLVDEYQDTNPIQSRMIDLFAGKHRHLMVVGDDAQSIYSWRGADFRNIMGFDKRYPGAKVYKIETNYRSVPEVLTLANESISANIHQFEKTLVPARESKDFLPAIIQVQDPNQQACFIGQRIEEIVNELGLAYSDVAILYRAHFHSMEVQMDLTQRGTPFMLTSGPRFFEQAHVKDVSSFMRFISNRRDEVAFKRMLKLVEGIGDVTADKLWRSWLGCESSSNEHPLPQSFSKLFLGFNVPARSEVAWKQLAYTLDELIDPEDLEPVAPVHMITSIVEGVYDDFAKVAFPNYEQRMQDIEQVKRYSEQYETLEEFLTKLSLETNAERQEDKDDKDKVVLSSVHQAKGLEWPVVFVIWLTQGMFPNRKALEADDQSEDAMEEERRLFYVAVTRACDQLYLLHPMFRPGGRGYSDDYYQSPSDFITELPSELMEEWDIGTVW
ncbi:MAG: UvrD-helicase domain-containing protein [Verrucomicrobiaceae bacterium]|nr:UvrD-helicase domain-containing protein [Verrucomicrobiaceae bacterium]